MSQVYDQKHYTVLEVAADSHELMIPQRTMWPCIACVMKHLDLWFAANGHTFTPNQPH